MMCFGSDIDSDSCSGSDISIAEDMGDPVFKKENVGEIHEGKLFFVIGKITGNRFYVDFSCDTPKEDIALRLEGRVSINKLSRSARFRDEWDDAETHSENHFLLKVNEYFRLQILFTIEAIMIAFNSKHIANFENRMSFHDISNISIYGDITDVHLDRQIVTDFPVAANKGPHVEMLPYEPYPTQVNAGESIPMPFMAVYQKGFFKVHYFMCMTALITPEPKSFTISIQVGQYVWPQPTVALQIVFTFATHKHGETGEPIIALNSFANGVWVSKEKATYSTGLRPGAEFQLIILHGKDNFEIIINENPITEYPINTNPKNIDTIRVLGDLYLETFRVTHN